VQSIAQRAEQLRGLGGIAFIHGRIAASLALSRKRNEFGPSFFAACSRRVRSGAGAGDLCGHSVGTLGSRHHHDRPPHARTARRVDAVKSSIHRLFRAGLAHRHVVSCAPTVQETGSRARWPQTSTPAYVLPSRTPARHGPVLELIHRHTTTLPPKDPSSDNKGFQRVAVK
jgi:hypothetical protein